jgi:hypothetical protein
MKTAALLAAALAAAALAGCASLPPSAPDQRLQAAQAAIGTWSDPARLSAAKLIEEYGPPDRIEVGRLVWNARGPWESTSVEDASYYDSDGGADAITQTVPYRVPQDKVDVLKAFSDHIMISKDGTKLSARSESEALNFLAINLAEEIIKDVKEPREARQFYQSTLAFAQAGKSSLYTSVLIYPPEP